MREVFLETLGRLSDSKGVSEGDKANLNRIRIALRRARYKKPAN